MVGGAEEGAVRDLLPLCTQKLRETFFRIDPYGRKLTFRLDPMLDRVDPWLLKLNLMS